MLREKFAKKKALLESNFTAIRLGYDYAMAHFNCPLSFHLERMDATRDSILLDGNSACGLGAVFAGATVGAWYPITPSTSLMEAYKEFAERYRVDGTTGQRRYCLIQAEDELSAAGMVLGASWAGARAFTATAGPGISLMSEFVGLGYYAEIPGVFVDVQRTGPSTGMPTRTQQGDLLSIAYLSHGDTKHIALFPANPEECFYFMPKAFDLAERFQTPVFVLTDLDIGMNDWMCRRLKWDDSYRPDRGKVLSAVELAEVKKFARYADTGGGVPARSLPGVHPKGAFFTRGSGHTSQATYTEDADEYREVMDRLARKLATAAEMVPQPEIDTQPNASFGIISIGGCDGAVREALHRLRADGLAVDYMRIRGFPFGAEVRAFMATHRRCFVVEQNRDAQLRTLIAIETATPLAQMIPILEYGGLPLTAGFVVDAISQHLGARSPDTLGSLGAASPVPAIGGVQ
jgi:2-oxoglutarate ferredoxin oxidoreductase subunit alpha